MSGQPRIATPFPAPPGAVQRALELLLILRRGDAEEMAEAGDLADLPRPWEPASCPDDLREVIWEWCDLVAAWINHEYAWRPAQMIPPCWPQHPHIARELAVLAVLRWNAEQATGPEAIEEWHRYAYPMFCDRMTHRLGESGCRTGKHVDWPAEGRFTAYTGHDAEQQRQRPIYTDAHSVAQLRAPRRA